MDYAPPRVQPQPVHYPAPGVYQANSNYSDPYRYPESHAYVPHRAAYVPPRPVEQPYHAPYAPQPQIAPQPEVFSTRKQEEHLRTTLSWELQKPLKDKWKLLAQTCGLRRL